AVADDAKLAAHEAGREQRELVGLVADDKRMPRVMPPLEPHHDIGSAGQPVHDLALALVAPLGADHGDVRHRLGSLIAAGEAGARDAAESTGMAVPSRSRKSQPRRAASIMASAPGSSPATVA